MQHLSLELYRAIGAFRYASIAADRFSVRFLGCLCRSYQGVIVVDKKYKNRWLKVITSLVGTCPRRSPRPGFVSIQGLGADCDHNRFDAHLRYCVTPIDRVWKLYHSSSTTTFHRCARRISTVACAVFLQGGGVLVISDYAFRA